MAGFNDDSALVAYYEIKDPGHEYKEDWGTATVAALAGGIVAILAMPNTNPAVVDEASLQLAMERAASRAYCDYGLFVGATADNVGSVGQLGGHVVGLKMYLNETFSTLSLSGKLNIWKKHFETILLSGLSPRLPPLHAARKIHNAQETVS
ncbi:hypothetical protein X801_06996 [Opisthorchis viverrini]|uniref:Uncharacterized protein n=1 Tax=Opisthorchis viverrini TaxID=6198 RepID=A0A1S8WRY8_OPIVI|nr:hypothetical protein X801_06996 [Opisthorchis viverrini]